MENKNNENELCTVVDKNNNILSSTKINKGWYLIRKGRATLKNKNPMIIQLNKEIEGNTDSYQMIYENQEFKEKYDMKENVKNNNLEEYTIEELVNALQTKINNNKNKKELENKKFSTKAFHGEDEYEKEYIKLCLVSAICNFALNTEEGHEIPYAQMPVITGGYRYSTVFGIIEELLKRELELNEVRSEYYVNPLNNANKEETKLGQMMENLNVFNEKYTRNQRGKTSTAVAETILELYNEYYDYSKYIKDIALKELLDLFRVNRSLLDISEEIEF